MERTAMIATALIQSSEPVRDARARWSTSLVEADDRVHALRTADAFQRMPRARLVEFAEHAEFCDFQRRDIIIRNNVEDQAMHVLLAGHVKLCQGGLTGDRLV